MAKFDSAVMKKNLRLYLAAALLLTSAVLSWSAFKNFAPASVAQSTSSSSRDSIIFNSKLGHSFWNEMMVSLLRGLPGFGHVSTTAHSYAMKAGGKHARGGVQNPPNLAPIVSDAVTPALSLPLASLPSVNPHSAWVEQPEPRTPASRLP